MASRRSSPRPDAGSLAGASLITSFGKGGYAILTVRAAGNTYLTTIYEGVHTAVPAITR